MDSSKKVTNPAPGFIKERAGSQPNLTGEQKAQLVRRGNELFNERKYDLAERIFLTTAYTDGLIRLGDVFYKRHDYAHAMRLYTQAPDSQRVEKVAKRMALVVRQWLIEEAKTDAAVRLVSEEASSADTSLRNS